MSRVVPSTVCPVPGACQKVTSRVKYQQTMVEIGPGMVRANIRNPYTANATLNLLAWRVWCRYCPSGFVTSELSSIITKASAGFRFEIYGVFGHERGIILCRFRQCDEIMRKKSHLGARFPFMRPRGLDFSREISTTLSQRVTNALDLAVQDTAMDMEPKSGMVAVGAWDHEEFLAHARLILAMVCTLAICLSRAQVGRNVEASKLAVFVYLIYSIAHLIVVRLQRHLGSVGGVALHLAEIVITSLITVYTGGGQSLYLGLYLFVLLVAACRWGFNGALLTACAYILFLFSDLIFPSKILGGLTGLMGRDASLMATLVLSAILITSAGLLGTLVEREKKRLGDAVVITRLVRNAVPEASFKAAIGNILIAVREHFNADLVRLAIQEVRGEQAFAWDVTRLTGKNGKGVDTWRLTDSARRASFAMPPEEVRRWLKVGTIAGDEKPGAGMASNPKHGTEGDLASGLRRYSAPAQYRDGLYDLQVICEQHSLGAGSWALLATSFSLEGKWLGRLTVYNPRRGQNPSADAGFLGSLVREVGPAVYGKYLVGRLRTRAQARARARLSQDLHDGIIQSLIGLEMQIDVLRRTQGAPCQHTCPLLAMEHLQKVVHDEIANLREEMQRVKPLEIEPGQLLQSMMRLVDRFRREQGVSARFVADAEEVDLSARVCTELVRIVQEALANVRKHSGAHKVVVSFGQEDGFYKLCVQDDGRGFGFTGRLAPSELRASSKRPEIIMERVDAIGGELTIESVQGSSARLEIRIPLATHDRVPSDN